MLIPNVVRTWAPAGQTPIHRHRQGRRDKISVISGISLSPRRHRLSLYHLLFFDNIGQEEVCGFVREWLRHLRGPLILLLVDNSSTHKGNPIAHLQRQHPRLHIEYFPSYAPELNPDEGVWAQAKRELANSCPRDVDELMEDILRSIDGIRSSPQKLRGCILQSDLPSSALIRYIIYAAVNRWIVVPPSSGAIEMVNIKILESLKLGGPNRNVFESDHEQNPFVQNNTNDSMREAVLSHTIELRIKNVIDLL